MAFLNADDLYFPWTLRTVASIFEALPEVEWLVSTTVTQLNSDGAAFTSGRVAPPSKQAFLDGLYVPRDPWSIGCIVQEGVFWRRSLWDRAKARLNLALGLGADFDLWCQFYRHAEPYSIAVPLAAMTRHRQQRSNDGALYQQECQTSLTALRRDLQYKPRWLGLKRRIIHSPLLRRATWRLCKRLFGYWVNAIDVEVDGSGYQTGWKTKTFRLMF